MVTGVTTSEKRLASSRIRGSEATSASSLKPIRSRQRFMMPPAVRCAA